MHKLAFASYFFISALLASCSGSGTSSSDVAPGTIAGTVALGAALPSTVVTLTDASGAVRSATTDDSGNYSIDTANLVKPFKLTVNVLMGDKQVKLSSVALDTGTRSNITPLTTAISGLMNSANQYDPTTLSTSNISESAIALANEKLKAALSNVMAATGVANTVNPITKSFVANGAGMDSVLDRVSVNWSDNGISIASKFVPLTDASSSLSTAVTLTANTTPAALPAGIEPPSQSASQKIINGLKKCFQLPVSQRLTYTTTKAGLKIYTPGSLHADCSENIATDYLFNGADFGQRWVDIFASADFDTTSKVLLTPNYVIDTSSSANPWPGDMHAYSYNIYLYDKNGSIYTRPEVFAKVNNELSFRGTQRRLDVSVQPQLTKVLDANGTSNFVEGRLRIWLNPTFVPDASGGMAKFNFTGTAPSAQTNVNGNQLTGDPLPKAMCAWVTGPLLQNGVPHDVNAPKGGVLIVPPHSAFTARRDYSAIRIKYPETFDPINVSSDKQQLLTDCKSSHNAGTIAQPNREIGSPSTNNAFTIDGAKLDANSSYLPKGYANLNDQYPTSLTRVACPASNAAAGTPVSGWCYPDKRANFVSNVEKANFLATFADPKDIRFTFYTFIDNSYSASSPNTAFSGVTDANAFFATAVKEHTRILGAIPFVAQSSGVYSGSDLFRTISPGNYLDSSASTVSADSNVTFNWTIPVGADGVDRVGVGGWFINASGRVGVATYSDSWAVSRGTLTQTNKLAEDWYGFDWNSYRSTNFTTSVAANANVTSGYREIWVRAYDKDNRQLQTVVRATR